MPKKMILLPGMTATTMTIQFNYDSNGGSGTRSYFLFDANQEYLQKYRAVISQFSEDSRVTTEIISES